MDLIERQAAIDEAEEWIEVVYCEDGDQRERDAIGHVIHGIKELPSVQTCEDAVSRADVIELVKDSYYNLAESIEDTWAMVADVEKLPAVQPQPEEDCDTCKHGFFGSRQCDNCRVRYPSHYEREEEHHGSD